MIGYDRLKTGPGYAAGSPHISGVWRKQAALNQGPGNVNSQLLFIWGCLDVVALEVDAR